MKKTFILAAISLLTLSVSAPTFADEAHNFTLVNGMGTPLTHFYVSVTKTDDWEEDVLGTEILESGDSTEIDFGEHPDEECHYDVKLVEKNKKSWTVMNLNLCETNSITFKKSGNKVIYTKE